MASQSTEPAEASAPEMKMRAYQLEMLEASMKENVIIAMPTGTGKTFIAWARMDEQLRQSNDDKIAWFCAPTLHLCDQQAATFARNLPIYPQMLLTSAQGVDTWTSRADWEKALSGTRIVTSTPDVLKNALYRGLLEPQRLCILIFDEAHRCAKSEPYKRIMEFILAREREDPDFTLPKLGLTASPTYQANKEKQKILEANMQARIITPMQYSVMLEHFANKPRLEEVLYSQTIPPYLSLLQMVESALREVEGRKYRFYNILPDGLLNDSLEQSTYCEKQLKRLFATASTILSELGPQITIKYIRSCIERFLEAQKNYDSLAYGEWDRERMHLQAVLTSILEDEYLIHGPHPELQSYTQSTEKLQSLMDILEMRKQIPDLTGLVFVKERAKAAALADFLNTYPSFKTAYRVGYTVGSNSFDSANRMMENTDPKQSSQSLRDFRSGKLNLLVTTNTLEEGIDVPECNIVVCFDRPENLVSFVQRRGRARAKNAEYFIFNYLFSRTAADWSEDEKLMIENYKRLKREDEADLDLENMEADAQDGIYYKISSTGAIITIDNAVQHLNYFCQTLRGSPAPEYIICPLYEGTEFQRVSAKVTLPMQVAPRLRVAQSQIRWRSKASAKKEAAFRSCVVLHENGLIDDHITPLHTRKNKSLYDDGSAITSLAAFHEIKSTYDPWHDVALAWKSPNRLCDHRLYFEFSDKTVVHFQVFLPVPIAREIAANMFWNANSVVQGVWTPGDLLPAVALGDQFERYKLMTTMLLDPTSCFKADTVRNDFVYLFNPMLDNFHVLQTTWWAGLAKPQYPMLSSLLEANAEIGIIHDFTKYGARFEFMRVTEAVPTPYFSPKSVVSNDHPSHSEIQKCVEASKLMKRRDFLHPIRPLQQRKDESLDKKSYYLLIDHCTASVLPRTIDMAALIIPSMLHVLEIEFIAEACRKNKLCAANINNTALMVEALAAPSACERQNYQRLEFLGDCILKMCTALQLAALYPDWHEDLLSRLKDKIVSNRRLARACLELGIEEYILTRSFTGAKWRPKYIGDLNENETSRLNPRKISTKILADVMEALIAAAFLDAGTETDTDFTDDTTTELQITKALTCIQLFLPDIGWMKLTDTNKKLLEPYIEDSNACRVDSTKLSKIEKAIDRRFKEKIILATALHHASYNINTATSPLRSYDVLEFVGDALLDYFVTVTLFEHESTLAHQRMHTYRTALVNADFLAYLCMELPVSVTQQELVPLEERESADQPEKRTTKKTLHLHNYMSYSSESLSQQLEEATKRHAQTRNEIQAAFNAGISYPWTLLASMCYPKAISDIVEAMLAAVYIDSGGSMRECAALLDRFGLFRHARAILQAKMKCLHPVEELAMLAGKQQCKVKYGFEADESFAWTRPGQQNFVCIASLHSPLPAAPKSHTGVVAGDNGAQIVDSVPDAHTIAPKSAPAPGIAPAKIVELARASLADLEADGTQQPRYSSLVDGEQSNDFNRSSSTSLGSLKEALRLRTADTAIEAMRFGRMPDEHSSKVAAAPLDDTDVDIATLAARRRRFGPHTGEGGEDSGNEDSEPARADLDSSELGQTYDESSDGEHPGDDSNDDIDDDDREIEL